MDKLTKLQSLCKASIQVNINDHLTVHESAKHYLLDVACALYNGKQITSDAYVLNELDTDTETLNRMYDSNSIVCVTFFPFSTNGSYTVYDSTLDNALDECLSVFNDEGGRNERK